MSKMRANPYYDQNAQGHRKQQRTTAEAIAETKDAIARFKAAIQRAMDAAEELERASEDLEQCGDVKGNIL